MMFAGFCIVAAYTKPFATMSWVSTTFFKAITAINWQQQQQYILYYPNQYINSLQIHFYQGRVLPWWKTIFSSFSLRMWNKCMLHCPSWVRLYFTCPNVSKHPSIYYIVFEYGCPSLFYFCSSTDFESSKLLLVPSRGMQTRNLWLLPLESYLTITIFDVAVLSYRILS